MTIQNILIAIAIAVNIIYSTFLYLNSSHEYKNIVHTIEKHSVHPIYGNYTKVDNLGYTCQPWDACKHKDDK